MNPEEFKLWLDKKITYSSLNNLEANIVEANKTLMMAKELVDEYIKTIPVKTVEIDDDIPF